MTSSVFPSAGAEFTARLSGNTHAGTLSGTMGAEVNTTAGVGIFYFGGAQGGLILGPRN